MKDHLRNFFTNHRAPTFAAFFVVAVGSIILISFLSIIGIGFVGTAYYDSTGAGTAQLVSDLAEHNFTEEWFITIFDIASYWILIVAATILAISIWGALHAALNKSQDILLKREKLKTYLDTLHSREMHGYCGGGATYSPNILVEIKDRIDSGEFDEVPI